jgi:hypothetical protein
MSTEKPHKLKSDTVPKRWSKYDPAWCDLVIDYGSKGKSRREIARELKIGKSALYDYIATYPEFATAMEEADYMAQAWWERQGREGINKGVQKFNAVLYQFIMRNRWRADYQDPQKHDVVGTGFLKFLEAARKGEFKTPLPVYPTAADYIGPGISSGGGGKP